MQNHLGNILGYASDISVSEVIRLTNQERAKSGLTQLQINSELSNAAAGKARDMFEKQYWSHTSPSGTEPWDFITGAGYSYRVAGENLARDFSNTSSMVQAWMTSPTHRDNIMHPRYQEIGIAVVNGSLDGVETTLVVQMFGAPKVVAVDPAPSIVESAQAQDSQQPASNSKETLPVIENLPVPETETEVETVVALGIQELKPTPLNRQVATLPPELVAIKSNPSETDPSIISQILVPVGTIEPKLLYSPLAIAKAFGLGIVLLMVFVLVYDLYVSNNQNTVRIVGKNFAHILFLLVVAFLILYFKGGVVE
jgi:hypothetical protein